MARPDTDRTPNTVRRAGAADRAAVRVLRLRSLKEDPEAFGSTYAGVMAQDSDVYWDRFFNVGPCFLATPADADSALGLARVVLPESEGAPVAIISVWVAPEARRAGCGRALLEACTAWASENAPGSPILLDVKKANVGARALYESCGFVVIGPSPEDGCELRMERLTTSG